MIITKLLVVIMSMTKIECSQVFTELERFSDENLDHFGGQTDLDLFPSQSADQIDDTKAEPNEPDERQCGIGPCKLSCCKRFSGVPVFVLCYGLVGLWMNSLSLLAVSQVTSIERHLGISSSKTGMIMSSNEIGYLVVVLFVSHFGTYTHIPRFLSMSGILFGFSVTAMSFGKFMEPKVWQASTLSNSTDRDKLRQYLCLSDVATPTSPPQSSFLPLAFWVFICAAFCTGALKSYRIPLLTYYVEANIKDKSKFGFYLGNSYTVMLFGPAVALMIGGFVSSLPVDLKATTMSKRDQRWVGAWWLGFVIVGVSCCLCSIPIMLFPRGKVVKRNINKKSSDSNTETKKRTKIQACLELPKSLWRILHQPLFVLVMISDIIEGLATTGWFLFSQKFIETQFNKTSQDVSLSLGVIIFFAIVIGTFFGGFLTAKLKLQSWGCSVIMFFMCISVLALNTVLTFNGCDNSDIIGLKEKLKGKACGCDKAFIVCGNNSLDYLSPCWAGCRDATNKNFSYCTEMSGGVAIPGLCALDCSFFTIYLGIVFFVIFFGTAGFVPSCMMLARSVEQRDQSLAIGTGNFTYTLFGTIPSTVLFGKVVDQTCELWSSDESYCVLYNREKFRLFFNGLNICLKSFQFLILIALLIILHRNKQKPPESSECDIGKTTLPDRNAKTSDRDVKTSAPVSESSVH